jgi:hypothetical protein
MEKISLKITKGHYESFLILCFVHLLKKRFISTVRPGACMQYRHFAYLLEKRRISKKFVSGNNSDS